MLLTVYSLTLFLSAFLLFWIQPLFGKMALPLLGGSPGVWNTAMLFFQLALLAGYSYVHIAVQIYQVLPAAIFARISALPGNSISDAHLEGLIQYAERSTWVVVAVDRDHLKIFSDGRRWQSLPQTSMRNIWTDDFSNILGALK